MRKQDLGLKLLKPSCCTFRILCQRKTDRTLGTLSGRLRRPQPLGAALMSDMSLVDRSYPLGTLWHRPLRLGVAPLAEE